MRVIVAHGRHGRAGGGGAVHVGHVFTLLVIGQGGKGYSRLWKMSRLPYHAAHRSRFPRTEMSSLRQWRCHHWEYAGKSRRGLRAWRAPGSRVRRAPGSGCGTRPARRAATREPSHIGTFVAGPSSGGIVETTGSQRGFPSDAKPPITAFQRVDPIRAPRSAIMSAVAIPDVSGKEVVHVRRGAVPPQPAMHGRRWRARAVRAGAAAPAAACFISLFRHVSPKIRAEVGLPRSRATPFHARPCSGTNLSCVCRRTAEGARSGACRPRAWRATWSREAALTSAEARRRERRTT